MAERGYYVLFQAYGTRDSADAVTKNNTISAPSDFTFSKESLSPPIHLQLSQPEPQNFDVMSRASHSG